MMHRVLSRGCASTSRVRGTWYGTVSHFLWKLGWSQASCAAWSHHAFHQRMDLAVLATSSVLFIGCVNLGIGCQILGLSKRDASALRPVATHDEKACAMARASP